MCENRDVTLNLSNLNIGPVVDNLILSPGIKSLILQNNNLEYLPRSTFESLPDLEYLDLSNNEIDVSNFFNFCYNNNKLESLLLDGNNNYEDNVCESDNDNDNKNQLRLSKYHCIFKNLKNLSLENVNIVNIIGSYWEFNFPKLSFLDLSGNNFHDNMDVIIKNIPHTVRTLALIETCLTQLDIQTLINVEELYLDGNSFNTLSNSDSCIEGSLCLGSLSELKKLFLSKCGIKNIDDTAFEGIDGLLELDLSDNDISEIAPKALTFLHSLKNLDLSRNNLSAIPDFSILQTLTELKLDEMHTFTGEIDKSVLSRSMINLKKLSLKNNQIRWVSSLFFDKLPSLEEIDLSNNNLRSLNFYKPLVYIYKVDLSYNLFTYLDGICCTDNLQSLKVLNLTNNQIKTISIKTLKLYSDDTNIII